MELPILPLSGEFPRKELLDSRRSDIDGIGDDIAVGIVVEHHPQRSAGYAEVTQALELHAADRRARRCRLLVDAHRLDRQSARLDSGHVKSWEAGVRFKDRLHLVEAGGQATHLPGRRVLPAAGADVL